MDKQLDKSKVNFFEKMMWKIQYRDLYKNFGDNILIMKTLLHDKSVREVYVKNKSEINSLLNRSEENFFEYKEKIFEILIYSIQLGKLDIVKNNISNIFILRSGLENGNKTKKILENDFEKKIDEDIHAAESSLAVYLENTFKNKDMKILTGHIYQNEIGEKIKEIQESRETKEHWLEHIKRAEDKIKNYQLSTEDEKIYMDGVKNGKLESSLQAFLQLRNNKNYEGPVDLRVRNIIRKNMEYSEYFLANFSNSNCYESMLCINNAINKTNMTITDIIAARGAYIDTYIDDKINENNIAESKRYMQLKYIGIPYDFLPSDDQVSNKGTKRALEIARIIEQTESMEELKKIKRNLDARKYFIEASCLAEIVDIGKKERTENVFNVKDYQQDKNDFIEYQGKKIQVINLKGEDYKGFIHVCTNMSFNDAEDKKEAFLKKLNCNLCTTCAQDDHMYMACRGDFDSSTIFGYGSDIEIFQFSSADIGSVPMSQKREKEKFYPNVYRAVFNGKQEYWNEPIDIYEDHYNEANIYKKPPEYILSMGQISEKDKEWAAAFEIPIVRMDEREYAEKFDNKYKNTLENISLGEISVENFKKLVIYDRQRNVFYTKQYFIQENSEFEGKNFWEFYKFMPKNEANKEKLVDIVDFLDGRNKKWKNELMNSLDKVEKNEFEQLISELGNLQRKPEEYTQ